MYIEPLKHKNVRKSSVFGHSTFARAPESSDFAALELDGPEAVDDPDDPPPTPDLDETLPTPGTTPSRGDWPCPCANLR